MKSGTGRYKIKRRVESEIPTVPHSINNRFFFLYLTWKWTFCRHFDFLLTSRHFHTTTCLLLWSSSLQVPLTSTSNQSGFSILFRFTFNFFKFVFFFIRVRLFFLSSCKFICFGLSFHFVRAVIIFYETHAKLFTPNSNQRWTWMFYRSSNLALI